MYLHLLFLWSKFLVRDEGFVVYDVYGFLWHYFRFRFYTTTCIYMRDCIHVWEIISSTWWIITPATTPTTSEFSMSVVQIKMLCLCSQFFVRIALVNDLLLSSCGISAIMLSVFQINDFCLGRLCRVELRLGFILYWSKIYFFHDSYKLFTQNRCD